MERLIGLLSILTILGDVTGYDLLSGPEPGTLNHKDNDRINKIFDYVMDHFRTRSGLTRWPHCLHELFRLLPLFQEPDKRTSLISSMRSASAMPASGSWRVTRASVRCAASGFNNLTNFNKQFREIVKCTPCQFQRRTRV